MEVFEGKLGSWLEQKSLFFNEIRIIVAHKREVVLLKKSAGYCIVAKYSEDGFKCCEECFWVYNKVQLEPLRIYLSEKTHKQTST